MRLMTVSNTLSPNASIMRASTSLEWVVRASNMVASTPTMSRSGLSLSCTFWIESFSNATARRAKNSQMRGIITPSEAVRAFTVSSPREGWQSMRITSYSSRTLRSADASTCSRATSFTSNTSAADKSIFAGSRSTFSTPVPWMTSLMSTLRSIMTL